MYTCFVMWGDLETVSARTIVCKKFTINLRLTDFVDRLQSIKRVSRDRASDAVNPASNRVEFGLNARIVILPTGLPVF
jgi:hypothetical protein